MHFISEELELYVEQHCSPESDLLQRLNKETYQKVLQPRMLSGHFQGRVLSMLSKLIRPEKVLELGTYTGYASLCLAEGLSPSGELHTIDIKEELVNFQRKYFDASGYGKQIFQHVGQALEIIPTLDGPFDLVFMDADKENYIAYFHLILPKMKPGGIILSDNVLWSGKVVEPLQPNDKSTQVLLEYNQLLATHSKLETVLLPIRDGLTVSRVLDE
ncbi:MAG: O-methyltransferase [Flavobacterium sp.]